MPTRANRTRRLPFWAKQHDFARGLRRQYFSHAEQAKTCIGCIDPELNRALKGLVARLRELPAIGDMQLGPSQLERLRKSKAQSK
jgi:hypothetical protein